MSINWNTVEQSYRGQRKQSVQGRVFHRESDELKYNYYTITFYGKMAPTAILDAEAILYGKDDFASYISPKLPRHPDSVPHFNVLKQEKTTSVQVSSKGLVKKMVGHLIGEENPEGDIVISFNLEWHERNKAYKIIDVQVEKNLTESGQETDDHDDLFGVKK